MSAAKHVLIVDDSSDLARVIADFLSMFEYQVTLAGDGLEALTILETQAVDVVVSDIHMPRFDGFQLLGEVREHHPATPVILITGFSVGEAQKMAFERGASAFVGKPFHLKELKDVIDEVLKPRSA
jgi:two-component system NtrC family response regulator